MRYLIHLSLLLIWGVVTEPPVVQAYRQHRQQTRFSRRPPYVSAYLYKDALTK